MRLTPMFLAALLTLAGCMLPTSAAQSSFGPEVSAEDYGQHLLNLQNLTSDASNPENDVDAGRKQYLSRQFARLGLPSMPPSCGDGFQAVLSGTEADLAPVLYTAKWQDAYQVAGVLEVAERFMTQRPRPKHDVIFLFSMQDDFSWPDCATYRNARLKLSPENLRGLSAMDLVIYLNRLHIAGK